jgi:hypothetical protein
MILGELPFGTFREIEPGILEIIIKEGIELRLKHIEQIEAGLLEKYSNAYVLLINRVYSYSHTVESMQKVAKLQNLTALAIVVYSDISDHTARIHRLYQDNVQVFDDRDRAIAWLKNAIPKTSEMALNTDE